MTILGDRRSFPQVGAVTTAPNQTVTIQQWNCTESTLIDWGDGNTTTHSASNADIVSHVYVAAGSYVIRLIVNPLAVRKIYFRNSALRPNSVDFLRCTGVTYFYWINVGITTFDSTHITAMPLTYLGLYNLPAGSSVTVAAADFDGWPVLLNITFSNCLLLQAQVDAILHGLYTGLATRTAVGGTITVGNNNAAPSGILQAQCPPITGKEYAYELANDSCGINPTKKWATVTITA